VARRPGSTASWTQSWPYEPLVWIGLSWIGAGLFLAPAISGGEQKGQALLVDLLFWVTRAIVAGALAVGFHPHPDSAPACGPSATEQLEDPTESRHEQLSRLGEVIEVSGEGCEGCVSFRGSFRVEAVLKDDIRRPLLEPLMVICEGTMDVSRSCQCPACPETWQELPGLRPQGLLFRSDLVSSSTAAVYGEHGAPH